MTYTIKLFALAGVLALSTATQASDDLFANTLAKKDTITNGLTEAEKADGWRLLYDGKSSKGWRTVESDSFPEYGWSYSEGALAVVSADNPGGNSATDIISNEKFGEFILEVEYKLGAGTNSGVKYFVDPKLIAEEGIAIGVEFQLRDEIELMKDYDREMMGDPLVQMTGSIFNMITGDGSLYDAKVSAIPVTPLGTWNKLRIVSKDNRVAHYLNGHKVIDYIRGNQMWRALVAYSKYADFENFGEHEKGYFLLQDHGKSVEFRSIKIKELD